MIELAVLAALVALVLVAGRHLWRLEERVELAEANLQALVEVLAAELHRRDEEPRT